MSKDPSDAKLIARYESLRRESDSLEARCEEIDSELVDIERRLPDDYRYPGDPNEQEEGGVLSPDSQEFGQ